MKTLNRRSILRGMLNGAAVTVGVPLLDCFLSPNGTALAAGTPLPLRFGTWYWGLGMNAKVFTPKTYGANFDLPEEIACLAPIRQHINLLSHFDVYRDSAPNLCHYTGWITLRSGTAPQNDADHPGESIDVTVAKKLGGSTRFPIITATATGDVRNTYSYENKDSINAAEFSPVSFYQRLYGADFQDPNASEFKPNPMAMIRKSVLSGVMEQSKSLNTQLGASDRRRLDQYFTGLREVERRLDQQLTKPDPIAACVLPKAPTENPPVGMDADLVAERHRLMTDLLVMAIACDQTRVFNMSYSASFAATIKPGWEKPHHATTHEEPVDPALGYQPQVSWFTKRSMEAWCYFVQAFDKVKEGDGTLLDNILVYANTDQSYAKIHSLEGLPMFTAGRAGGRVKTGLHVDGAKSPGTRLGYTAMKVMGVDLRSWGTQSNGTSKEIGEILV